MGPAKKKEVISFSRQVFLVHKTHGHLLQGIANGRKELKTVHAEPKASKNTNKYTPVIEMLVLMN